MTREEFVQFLARCVADGAISEGDAAELVLRYDRGELGDGWELPVAPDKERNNIVPMLAGALAGLALYLRKQNVRTTEMTPAQVALRGPFPFAPAAPALTFGRNIGNANRLITGAQTEFEAMARGLATQLSTGRITVAQWQLGIEGAIRTHIVQQAGIGGGSTVLTPRQWAEVERIMGEQTAYLSRFADTVALRQGQGAPLSEAYIGNRAEAYGGVGRGLGFSELEAALVEDGSLPGGWVCDYISMDDSATCTACLEAQRQGPYLPGRGPFPGQVCLGRQRCRCRREYRYDPVTYARLTGTT